MASAAHTAPPPAMDHTSRLLAMLNSAGLGGPSKVPSAAVPTASSPTSAQTQLAQPGPTRSADPSIHQSQSQSQSQPQPHPAARTFGAADLLRTLGSPPSAPAPLASPSSAASPVGPTSPKAPRPVASAGRAQRAASAHQTSMLQMLAGGSALAVGSVGGPGALGRSVSGPSPSVGASALGTPPPDAELGAAGGSRNLLDLLNRTGQAPATVPFPTHQPVIEHPVSPAQASVPPAIRPDSARMPPTSPGGYAAVAASKPFAVTKSPAPDPPQAHVADPPQAQAQAQAQAVAPAQMPRFQSFSPFDVFDAPPKASTSVAGAASPVPASAKPPHEAIASRPALGVQKNSQVPISSGIRALSLEETSHGEEGAAAGEGDQLGGPNRIVAPDVAGPLPSERGVSSTGAAREPNRDPKPDTAETDGVDTSGFETAALSEGRGQQQMPSSGSPVVPRAAADPTPVAGPSRGTSSSCYGPKRLQGGEPSIDASQADPEALVDLSTAPRRLSEKTNTPRPYSRGNRVAISSALTVYALDSGALRIKLRSPYQLGAVSVPATYLMSRHGPVLDVAVSGYQVAAIGPEGDVAVMQVPSDWRPKASDEWPPVIGVLYLPIGNDGKHGIQRPFKVEWIRRNGKDNLVIAGKKGLVIIDPAAVAREDGQDLGDVVRRHKVLETEGELLDFSINHTQQAIALLGPECLTLYSAAQLQRVWHRDIPTSSPDLYPSSCQFCEANLIIGRGQDTVLDLLQITQLSVLSTIRIAPPANSAGSAFWTRATWDQASGILWVSVPNRAGLYAFRYARKGQQQPVRNAEAGSVAAWDRVAELPMGPILGYALAPSVGQEGKSTMVYATAEGTFELEMPGDLFETSSAVVEAPPKKAEGTAKPAAVKQKKEAPVPARSANRSPVKTAQRSSSPVKRADAEAPAPAVPTPTRQVDGSSAQDDIGYRRALQETEEKLTERVSGLMQQHTTQLLARLEDSQASRDPSRELVKRLEASVKSSLTDVVQSQLQRTLFPAFTAMVQHELQGAKEAVPNAVYAAMKDLPREIEKVLGPVVERTVNRSLSDAVEQAVEEAVRGSVLPALADFQAHLSERLMEDMRSEMLQIRKDLPPAQPMHNHIDFQMMSNMMTNLQAQVTKLSEQLAQTTASKQDARPANMAPMPYGQPAAPRQVSQQGHIVSSAQIPIGSPVRPGPEVEDEFLSALMDQSTSSTVGLIDKYWDQMPDLFPSPPGRSPLSQAVLLTLLQRVTFAMVTLPAHDAAFYRLLRAGELVMDLVNPQEPAIAAYIPRLMPVIMPTLVRTLQRLQSGPPDSAQAAQRVGVLLEKLHRKGQGLE